ncbi:peroxiredoxin [Synechococcus sp. M16CYN]|uniref:peroxiredoxin n=1 Tax=Synechococcus sp. M16CYN TaxID=3103139 RepID=UPI00333F52B1
MRFGIGDHLPNFSLGDQNGNQQSTSSLQGHWLVLFFYPKDETPGCTAEVCSFRDNKDVFKGLNAKIWGVSGDDAISHRRFADRHKVPFPLLCDRNNSLRRQMGVAKGLGFLLPGRVTYVVDPTLVIRHIFSNLLDGPAHVREAERVLKALQL